MRAGHRELQRDWSGDVPTRKSCSAGVVLVHGAMRGFWSKLQSNVALSSAEAELNASMKGLFEMMGVCHLYEEFFGCELVSFIYRCQCL